MTRSAYWRAEIDEFCQACRVGKAETDDLVERSTVQHICGYHVEVEELDRHGHKHTLRKNVKHQHQLSMDDAFLRFLDQMEERAQLEKARDAPRTAFIGS